MRCFAPLLITATGVCLAPTSSAEALEEHSQRSVWTMPLIPHHVQRRRRLDRPPMNWTQPPAQVDTFDMDEDELFQGYGTHYVDLWVGTPPQRQTVIVDTGSSVTAFPCGECNNCGAGYHIDDYFQEEDSSTFQDVECQDCWIGKCNMSPLCELSVSYQEGSSWKAYEVTDLLYSGGDHTKSVEHPSFRLHFGCQTRVTGLFKTQLADGILGMEISASSFWKQAFTEKAIHRQAFSLCFSRQMVATKEGTGAGVLTLGGSDDRLHSTTMIYAHQPKDQGWFTVHVKALYLRTGGGESVQSSSPDATIQKVEGVSHDQLNRGDVIVDSGTTDTYLSTALAGPFKNAWRTITGGQEYEPDEGVHLSDQELLALPTILVQLHGFDDGTVDPMSQGLAGVVDPASPNDVLVAIPPTHYMEYSEKTQTYTPRIYFTESHGGVLGANFMMGHDIFFDVEKYRLGFAESNCEYDKVADSEASGR